MRLLRTKADVAGVVAAARAEGRTVALVPTMGALHDGHLSLVRRALADDAFVVVSVFVNPTQFGPGEDLDRYPRDLEGDRAKLESAGVAAVFAPTADEIYGPLHETDVVPGALAHLWEGSVRPGHFEGVATVVVKLLNIVRPDAAYFGEKDYQQLKVVEAVVRDLDLAIPIVGCPIVRDADGLALSSRNAYLSPPQRQRALAIPGALDAARVALAAGVVDGARLVEVMRSHAEDAGVPLDYGVVVDLETLVPVRTVRGPVRALIAGRVGSVRLIDNARLHAPV